MTPVSGDAAPAGVADVTNDATTRSSAADSAAIAIRVIDALRGVPIPGPPAAHEMPAHGGAPVARTLTCGAVECTESQIPRAMPAYRATEAVPSSTRLDRICAVDCSDGRCWARADECDPFGGNG